MNKPEEAFVRGWKMLCRIPYLSVRDVLNRCKDTQIIGYDGMKGMEISGKSFIHCILAQQMLCKN